MKQIDYKVPNGKLLRISAEIDNNIITKIKINGDFFIHPENGIDLIEQGLIGEKINKINNDYNHKDNNAELFKKLTIITKDLQIIGFSIQDLIEVLVKFIN